MPFFSGRCYSTAKLIGKTAIITGCNTGIGKATALDFYKRGAKVIMACRSLERAEQAKADIEKKCENVSDGDKGDLVLEKCDLSSLQSVRDFAKKMLETEPQVNILVNNAGVMMCPYMETKDGFEMQFGTNHLGHFLLTLMLMPRIKESKPARIVTVSSNAHWRAILHIDDFNFKKTPYKASDAYCQSKFANVLFSKELARKLKEHNVQGVTTYSLHPGVIKTDLGRHLDDTLFRGARMLIGLLKPFFKTPEQGAQTTIYCALDEKCAEETGLYYSDCAVVPAAAKSEDAELAARLWDVSWAAVGLGDYQPFTDTIPPAHLTMST